MLMFFQRLGALTLSGLFLTLSGFGLYLMKPQSLEAWGVKAVLGLLAIGASFVLYRVLVGSAGDRAKSGDIAEGLAPGIAVGEMARRGESEGQMDDPPGPQ